MALSAEDRLDIMQLAARYNQAIDGGDARTWVATFTPDGTFEAGEMKFAGAEELEAFARGFPAQVPNARHGTNNRRIEGDGDEATLSCYLHLMRVGDGAETVLTGRYDDRLHKVDGEWKFTHRRATFD